MNNQCLTKSKHPLGDAANFVFVKLRTVPPDGLQSSLLAKQNPKAVSKTWPKRGQLWSRAVALGPFKPNVTFSSPLLFFPDNKHSSDRQQQAGRRPCAILVRHTLLLQASWTKSFSFGTKRTRVSNFRETRVKHKTQLHIVQLRALTSIFLYPCPEQEDEQKAWYCIHRGYGPDWQPTANFSLRWER